MKLIQMIFFFAFCTITMVTLPLSTAEAVTIYTEQNLVPDITVPNSSDLNVTNRSAAHSTSTLSDNIVPAMSYSDSVSSLPISVIPLVVSIVETPISATLVDFVFAKEQASEPAIFIFSEWKGPLVTSQKSQRAQDHGPFDNTPRSRANMPDASSILLVLTGILMILAAKHRLKQ
jgi:hypothetical protein